jgi:hypothetical protein
MCSAKSNMASNFTDEDPSTSSVISLSSQPNSSSFQNSCTRLVLKIPLGSISDCLLPSLEEKSTPKSTYHSGGGIICCVPNCFNNSIWNKDLCFYVIPKDSNLRRSGSTCLKGKILSLRLLIEFVQPISPLRPQVRISMRTSHCDWNPVLM